MMSFTTPKDKGDITIAYYGDLQGSYSNLDKVITAAKTLFKTIDLNMFSGDISDNGHHHKDWFNFYKYNQEHLVNSISTSAIGNHDTTDEGLAFSNYFYGPNNGINYKIKRRNYYFNIGDALIFNFDTEAGFNSYDSNYYKQIELLKNVIKKSNKTFKIVLMHRSVYPVKYNEKEVRKLASVFEQLNIDLVLSGHDHIYSRTTIKDSQKVKLNNGVTYIVAGTSSGAKYYKADINRPWIEMYYDNNHLNFIIIEIKENKSINLNSYAIINDKPILIDSIVLNKKND